MVLALDEFDGSSPKPPVDNDGGKVPPHVTLMSSVSVSSTVPPFSNTSHSRKQFDGAGCPSIVTFCTNTVPPVPSEGLPAKLVAVMVGVVLKIGVKKEMEGKKGEERRYWRVAGTG